MWPYWLLFMLTGWMAISRMRAELSGVSVIERRSRHVWWLSGLALTLMIGLRHKVGGDWDNYLPKSKMFLGKPFRMS